MKKSLLPMIVIGLLSVCSTANALVVNLDISDSRVRVGESFSIDVSLSGVDAALLDLTAWGFLVDPLAALDNVLYQGATVAPEFLDASFSPSDVGGLNPGFPTGSDIHLATLSFVATSVGSDTLHIDGPLDFFHGLVFQTGDFAINESVNINVVPDSSVYGFATLGLLVSGMGLARKRFSHLRHS